MDTGNRISEIQRKLEGKTGYDYYNSFQRAVEEYCSDKKSAKPKAILAAPANEIERKYNTDGFNAFVKKFGMSLSLGSVKKQKIYLPEGANLEISINPAFSVEKGGVKKVFLPWLIQKPELTQKYRAVACYVMQQAYKSTNLGNCQFNIVDFVAGKIYSQNQITNNTKLIVNSDSKTISDLLGSL